VEATATLGVVIAAAAPLLMDDANRGVLAASRGTVDIADTGAAGVAFLMTDDLPTEIVDVAFVTGAALGAMAPCEGIADWVAGTP